MKKSDIPQSSPSGGESQLAFRARRQPQQARSRAMVARLLQAATDVFLKEGFEAATTNRIAEAAGVSVGSLYQFYPNKHALLAELQRIWTGRLGAELDVALTHPERPLGDIIDEVLGVHTRLQRESAGLLGFLLTIQGNASALSVRHAVQDRLEGMMCQRRPELPRAQARLMVDVCIHISDALYLVQPGDSSDPHLRWQVRQALLGYLNLALGTDDVRPAAWRGGPHV